MQGQAAGGQGVVLPRSGVGLTHDQLVLALSGAGIGAFVWDVEPDRVTWDAALAEMFGSSGAGSGGGYEKFIERLHPEDRARIQATLRTARESRGRFVSDYRIVAEDGTERWLSVRATFVDGPYGLQLVGAAVDVSGRRSAAGSVERHQDPVGHAQAVGERNRFAYIVEASAALSRSLDLHEVTRRALDFAVPRLADWAAIYLIEDGALRPLGVRHPDPAKAETAAALARHHPVPLAAAHVMGRAVSQREPILVADVDRAFTEQAAPTTLAARLQWELGAGAVLAVPLVSGGRDVGAMTFVRLESHSYHADDVALAFELAQRIAVAMDNAWQYGDSASAVQQLQRALVPEALPELPGLELAARYLPSATRDVGGDWYDAFVLDDEHVAFTVGDVAGHGLVAAALMAQCRHALRAYALGSVDPVEVLQRLNDLMVRLEPDAIVTAVYGVLHVPTRRVQWASAGHLAPLVANAAGATTQLAAEVGPPLGAGAGWTGGTQSFELQPGDWLLACSDGLVERRGEDIAAGLDRLADALTRAVAVLPEAQQICDRVVADALTPVGAQDDVCLLLLHVTG